MKLIYAYIEQFRNIFNQEIYFSDDVVCDFSNKKISVRNTDEKRLREIIYGESLVKNLHILVGKTGSGKTNILQLIGMDDYSRHSDDKYLLLYQEEKDTHSFILELHNIDLGIDVETSSENSFYHKENQGLFRVNMRGENISSISPISLSATRDCLIINCFDKNAFSSYPYFEEHDVRINNYGHFLPRLISPFEKTDVALACRWIKRYISSFPESSTKRNARLTIKSENWAKRIATPVDKHLILTQYWSCKDVEDDVYEDISPMIKRSVKKYSAKQKFLHDLLADYALYLREFLEQYRKEEKDFDDDLGVGNGEVGLSNKPNPYHTPDHWGNGSVKHLIIRIEWLAKVIDRNSDEMMYPNGEGLVWQISSYIIDIYNLLNKMPDDYFTIDTFSIPITDIIFGNGEPMDNLFERMTAYHSDEIGLFYKELLPYSISGVSSGEYQFAKVLGAIEEYCVNLKLTHTHKKEVIIPDFILLLDEPETYMHPDMARRFIAEMDWILRDHAKQSELQVIMSTHNPFLLSDVTSSQITRLDYDMNGNCIVVKSMEQTFASEIHSIMANEFFLKFTIGEYSRRFLTECIERLKYILKSSEKSEDDIKFISDMKIVRSALSDKLLQSYFSTLLETIE